MIKEIEITNFLSIGHIHITDLETLDIVGVMGSYVSKKGYSNGAGKSSVLEAVLYALTGIHRYGKFDVEIIHNDETACKVKLVLLVDGMELQIERYTKKKSEFRTNGAVKVILDGDIKATSTKEAQVFLNNFLGITPKGFLYSFFFRQKEYDALLKDRPSNRLQFLESFFGATLFDAAKKVAGGQSKLNKEKLLSAKSKLDSFQESLNALDSVEDLEATKNEAQVKSEKLNVKLKSLKQQLIDIPAKINTEKLAIKEAQIIVGRYDQIELELTDLESKIKRGKIDLEECREERNGLEKELVDAQKELSDFLAEDSIVFDDADRERFSELQTNVRESSKLLGVLEGKKSNIQDQLKSLNSVVGKNCPTCMQDLTPNKHNELVSKLDKQWNELNKESKILDENISKYTNGITILTVKRKHSEESVKKENELKSDIIEINHNIEVKFLSIENKISNLEALQDQIVVLKKEQKNLKVKTLEEKVTISEDKIIALSESLEECEDHLSVCENKLDRLKEIIMKVNFDLKEHAKISKSIEDQNKLCETIQINLSDSLVLVEVFTKCRMEVISTGISELEQHATDILNDIGATQKEIIIETQKLTGSGNYVDRLDIYLVDSKGKRSVEGLSGGEWDLASFAIRTALSKYKLQRMDSKIDFLVLDEVFGALDDVAREELITVIRMFKEEFAQVFVISHTDLKNIFEHSIQVEMDHNEVTHLKNAI